MACAFLLLLCDSWPVAYGRMMVERLHTYDVLRMEVRAEGGSGGLSVDCLLTVRIERPGPVRLLLSGRVEDLAATRGDAAVPCTFGAGGCEAVARRLAPEGADIPFLLALAPDPPLAAGDEATFRLRYLWKPAGWSYAGRDRVQTHLNPFWLPAMADERFDAVVTVPAAGQALGPGRRTRDGDAWRFESTSPVQVVALVVGRFEVHGRGAIELLVPPGADVEAAEILADAERVLATLTEWYGPAAPETLRIAIEPDPRPAASYCTDAFIVLNRAHLPAALGRSRWLALLAHECAHLWWGHRVATPVLGQGGTWLREGLAQYSGIEVAGALLGAETRRDLWRSQVRAYLGRADLRRKGPLIFANEATLRDATYLDDPLVPYVRGALVFRLMEHRRGAEAFRGDLRRWAGDAPTRFAAWDDFPGDRALMDYYAATTRLPDVTYAVEGGRLTLRCADPAWPGGRVPVRVGGRDVLVEVRGGEGSAVMPEGANGAIEIDPERIWLDPRK